MAEIAGDGASTYSRSGDSVQDSDSYPDSDMTNDDLVDTDDVDIDQVTGDEDHTDDRAIIDFTEVPALPPDLMIIKMSAPPRWWWVPSNVDFTLTVTNNGQGPAVAAVAVDTLPAGMEPVSLPGSMTYDAGTRQLTWAIGDLAPGAVARVTYTVKITATSGRLVNVVVVESESSRCPARRQLGCPTGRRFVGLGGAPRNRLRLRLESGACCGDAGDRCIRSSAGPSASPGHRLSVIHATT